MRPTFPSGLEPDLGCEPHPISFGKNDLSVTCTNSPHLLMPCLAIGSA